MELVKPSEKNRKVSLNEKEFLFNEFIKDSQRKDKNIFRNQSLNSKREDNKSKEINELEKGIEELRTLVKTEQASKMATTSTATKEPSLSNPKEIESSQKVTIRIKEAKHGEKVDESKSRTDLIKEEALERIIEKAIEMEKKEKEEEALIFDSEEKELCDKADKLMREACYQEALNTYNKILEMRTNRNANDRLITQIMTKIGHVYYELGNYEEALKYHNQALETRKKSLPKEHPDIAESLNNIGKILTDQGKYKEALDYHNSALTMNRRTLPTNHPSIAETLHNIGRVYDCQLNYDNSLKYYTESLDIKEQTLPLNHPDIAATLKNIGIVYANKKRFKEAIDMYNQALDIYNKTLASNHPHIAATYNCIGFAYINQRKYEHALENFSKSLEMYEQTLPCNHPHIGTTLHNLGLAYHKQAKFEEALRYYYQSLEIKKLTMPSDHPKVLKTSNNISLCPMSIRKKVEQELEQKKENEKTETEKKENSDDDDEVLIEYEKDEKDLRPNQLSSDFNKSTKLRLFERSNSINEPPMVKEIVNDRYVVKRVLEKGDFGHVALVYDETKKNEKEMNLLDIDPNKDSEKLNVLPELSDIAENELRQVQSIEHLNIVRYFDSFQSKIAFSNYFCLITEHIKKQSLRDRIEDAKTSSRKFNEETTILTWLLQIVSGLEHLHLNGVIHRDINPSNIFICENNQIKLGNFGFHRLIRGTKASKYAISSPYMSPEQFRYYFEPESYSFPTDIWSLACVIYELIFLQLAFPLGQRGDSKIPHFENSLFTHILLKMFEKNPANRISAKDLQDNLLSISASLNSSNIPQNITIFDEQ